MMAWQDELKRQIEASRDAWERSYVAPSGAVVEEKTFAVPVSAAFAWKFVPLINRVNGGEFAGCAPLTIMLTAIDTEGDAGRLTFTVRKSVPWDHLVHPETGRFVRVTAGDGTPLYTGFDFNTMAETWRDRPAQL